MAMFRSSTLAPFSAADPVKGWVTMFVFFAEEKGWSQTQVDGWLKMNGLSLHHAGGNNIQLIPSQLHGNPRAEPPLNGIRHMGAAYDLRRDQ
jgi:hypothetical protein